MVVIKVNIVDGIVVVVNVNEGICSMLYNVLRNWRFLPYNLLLTKTDDIYRIMQQATHFWYLFFQNPNNRNRLLQQFRDPPDVRILTRRVVSVKRVLLAQLLINLCPQVSARFDPFHHRLLLATILPQIEVIEF